MKSRWLPLLLGGFLALFNLTIVAQPQQLAVSTVAGLANYGYADGVRNAAKFLLPTSIALDSSNNLYVADGDNFTIRKITAAGVVTTIAGQPQVYGTNDGQGTNALFGYPYGIAVDSSGDVFVADTVNDTIRKITPGGAVSTIAGKPTIAGANSGSTNTALFSQPFGLAVDLATNIYVADNGNSLIRKISGGVVSNIGTSVSYLRPYAVAVDKGGNVYVLDWGNDLIRQIAPSGSVTTVASTTTFNYPQGIAVDSATNLYIADTYNQIIRVVSGGSVYTLAGSLGVAGDADGLYPEGTFNEPWGIAVDSSGTVYVGDSLNANIRKITTNGLVSTFAGPDESYGTGADGPVDGPAAQARFYQPTGVATDGAGNIYVADSLNNCIRLITPSGTVTTIAGSDIGATGSADGTNTSAEFNGPTGLCLDAATNIYVADFTNSTIRKITPDASHSNWVTTTIAGAPGIKNYKNATGTNAWFHNPYAVAVDSASNIYVTDVGNEVVRKIDVSKNVTLFAGTPGVAGFSNNAVNAQAQFGAFLAGIAVDALTNIYVADYFNNTVRVIASTGGVTNLSSSTAYDYPEGVAVDKSNNIYIANSSTDTIVAINGTTQAATTIAGTAGNGIALTGSVDGLGPAAEFDNPSALAVDSSGIVYIADQNNNTIRKGTPYIAGQTVLLSLQTSPSGLAAIVDGTNFSSTPQLLTFPVGTSVTNTAGVNAGYAFTNWTSNGVPVSTAATYINVLNANETLTANYFPGYTLSLTASPSYAGTVSANQAFLLGTTNSVTVIATTNTGYLFTGWTTNGSSTVASALTNYSFTITNNLSLVANFTPIVLQSIQVLAGTSVITNTQTNPAVSFGSAQYPSNGPTITFTITNSGNQTLTLQTPGVPAGYSLTVAPPSSIPGGSSATFAVQFNSGSAGTRSGNILITNNDTAHNPFSFAVTGTIIPAPLTIVAQPQTITYGATVPGTTVTYSGFVNGDTNTALTTQPTNSSAQHGIVSPGTYTGNYTASGAVANNYSISYTPGNLTVGTLAVVLTGTRHYDGTTAATNSILTVSNVVGSDSVNLASGSAILASKNIGTPTITSTGTLTLGGAQAGNYTLSGASGAVIVTGASLTITAQPQTTTYGSNVPATTVTYSGFVNGETNTALTTQPIISSAQHGVISAGTYTGNYTVSNAADTNYTISYVAGDLTVNGLPVILTGTRHYDGTAGATNSILTVSNFVGGDSVNLASGSAVLSTTNVGTNAITSVGTLTLGGSQAGNYTLTNASGAVIVTAAPLTVTAQSQTTTYGSNVPATTVTYSGFVNGETNSVLVSQPSVSSARSGVIAAGIYPNNYSVSNAVDTNYSISYFPGTLFVLAAPLTITAQSQTITHGQTVPTTTVTYGGFVNSETNTALTSPPTISSTQSGVAAIGNYPGNYTASGAADPNYSISYIAGNLTVNPAGPEMEIFNGTNLIVNNQTNPPVDFGVVLQNAGGNSLTFTITNTGDETLTLQTPFLPGGYILTAPLTNSIPAGSNGTFTVQQVTTSGGTFEGNIVVTNNSSISPYSFAVIGTITTAQPQLEVFNGPNVITNGQTNPPISFGTNTYGSTPPVIVFTITNFGNQTLNLGLQSMPSGFIVTTNPPATILSGNGGSFSVQLPTSSPGAYSGNIVITNNDTNHNPFLFGIAGTVIPAPLLITAQPQTNTYGQPVPATTINYNGFVNGETSNSLTSQPHVSSAQSGTPGAGTYISNYTASGAVDTNYTITYAGGNLQVNPLPVLLTGTRAFDGTAIATNSILSVSNKVGSDNITVASGSAILSSTNVGANPITSVGTLTLGGAQATNYTLSGAGGSVIVTLTPLMITAQPQSITYGSNVPITSTVTYSGFVNGETNTALTTQPTVSSTQHGVVPAGTYTNNYTASGAVDSNYSISYTAGNLTVNALAVVLTGTRHYDGTAGATNSILTVSNIIGSDSVNPASGSAILSTTNAGTNAITSVGTLALGGSQAGNYTLTGASGTVIVTPAPLSITALPQTILYGSNVPSSSLVTYSGFVNGETNTVLTAPPQVASARSGIVPAGTYSNNFIASGAAGANYSITFMPGTLFVNPTPLTITAQSQTITHGQTVPATTVTYGGFVNSETNTALTTPPIISSTQSGVAAIGNYPGNYTASGAADPNYSISYIAGNLTVNPAGPEMEIFNGTNLIVNDQTNPPVDFGVVLQNAGGNSLTFTITNTGDETLTLQTPFLPGGYILTAPLTNSIPAGSNGTFTVQQVTTSGGTFEGNIVVTNNSSISPYSFAVIGTITTAQPQLEVFNGPNVITNGQTNPPISFGTNTYGSTPPVIVFTITNFGNQTLNLGLQSMPSGFIVTTNPPATILSGNGGSFSVQLPTSSPGAYSGNIVITNNDTNHNPFLFGIAGTVIPAPLLITAQPQTNTYGQPVPAATINYNGFVNGETSNSLTSQPHVSSAQSGTPGAGTYISNYTASGAVDTNYTITYAGGNLQVNPLPVLLTGTRAFDGTAIATNSILSVSNKVGSDNITVASGSAILSSTNVGANPITSVGTLTLGGAQATNYTLSGAGGSVIVTLTPLMITAQPQSITYGSNVPITSTVTYSGFVNGETNTALTTQPTVSSTQHGVVPAGTYTNNYTASGAVDSNYSISYTAGNLTVNALAVVLTGTRHYDGTAGATNSILTVSNKVGSDNVTIASGSGVLSTTNVGTNAITSFGTLALGGSQVADYTLTGAGGSVIVTPAPLVITPQSQSTTYGSNVPPTTVTYSGFVGGETNTTLSIQPTVSSARTNVAPAGTYTNNYTASGAVDTNYTITYVGGNLTVHPAALLITAQPQTITSGQAVPATTVAYSGFVNGDTSNSLTTPPTISSVQSGIVAPGVYTNNYTASGAVDANYSITYNGGTLTVNATGPQIALYEGPNSITNQQPNAISFGTVPLNQIGPILAFTISNMGGANLELGTIITTSNFVVVTNPPATIAGGSNGSFYVQFVATNSGVYPGTVTFTNNVTNLSPFSFPITATVNGAVVSLSGNLDFGVLVANSSAQASLTISNAGNTPLTISNITFPEGFSGTWSSNIAAGATQSVAVNFLPTAPIYYQGVITVISDALNGVDAISASGFGANADATLTILTNGAGKVTPDLAKTLKVGTPYSLTATAAAGNLFSNWSGSINTNKATVSFKMHDSMILQANFVVNPFLNLSLVGTYNGLFYTTNGVTENTAGMVKGLTVNQKGVYSGALLFNGVSHALAGTFSVGLQATNIIKLPSGQGNLVVTMNLAATNNAAPQITGLVIGTNSGTPWQAGLVADYATNVIPSSAYTMLIPPETNTATLPPDGAPGGDGYLVINYVATPPKSAKATITGALADGTPISQSVQISDDGFVPVYSTLYGGKGVLLGWINLKLDSTNFGVNHLTWIHPPRNTGAYRNGFTNFVAANSNLLSAWTNAPFSDPVFSAMTNLSILASIDDTNDITNVLVSINGAGQVTGNEVTGTVKPKTGLLTVSIGKGATKVTGYGVILLNTNVAGGYYLTKTNTAQAIKLSPSSQ